MLSNLLLRMLGGDLEQYSMNYDKSLEPMTSAPLLKPCFFAQISETSVRETLKPQWVSNQGRTAVVLEGCALL